MGVFGEFLSFDGRVGRLGYLWRSVVMLLALMGVAGLATAALATVFHPDGVQGALDMARDVITGAFLMGLWSSFALATRRLRDMGLEPAHVVPLYAAFWVINAVLLEPMSRLDPGHYQRMESAWTVLQWLAAVPLIFWPSQAQAPAPLSRYTETPQPTAYLNWRESA
ncbi:MAG: DUF805 domain-containing protein [Caulobacterales bacterium]